MRTTPILQNAAVIGTGLMGTSIAAALANIGLTVTIIGRCFDRTKEAVRKVQADIPMSRGASIVAGRWDAKSLDNVGLVCEAIVEQLDQKRTVLQRVAQLTEWPTIITTNTSSLLPSELARSVRDPSRFAGMHFLYPAHRTSVVEIAATSATAESTVDALVALAGSLDMHPIVIRREVRGFVWNRIQMAVLRECMSLLREGVADLKDIDEAVSSGLAPRWMATGPIMSVDLGGVRLFRDIANNLYPVLANDSRPGGFKSDNTFYSWTPDVWESILTLRDQVSTFGRDVARRRPRLLESTDATKEEERGQSTEDGEASCS